MVSDERKVRIAGCGAFRAATYLHFVHDSVHVCILVAGRLTIYRRNKKGDNGSPMVVHVIQPALRSLAAAIAADRAAQTGKPPDDE
jgi:hypothetical protein